MIESVKFDLQSFESSHKRVEKVYRKFGETTSRKTLIEAGNEAIVDALKRHFALREKDPPKSSGFPNYGQIYPKNYFWRGTRGNSLAEKIRVPYSSPDKLISYISIDSPALAHKLSTNPPPITPTGGRKYLAIPANPAAASWSGMPRDFPGGLRFAFSKTPDGHWLPSLVAANNYLNKNDALSANDKAAKKGANSLVYYLVRKAQTKHDPNALPQQRDLLSKALNAIKTAVKVILQT